MRLPWHKRLARRASAHALPLYAGAIALVTVALVATLVLLVQSHAAWPWWALALSACVWLVATSQLAVALANWLATLLVAPQPLPRMDYASGIAPASRTLVVVPTMLGSPEGIEALVDALEVRFLGNRDAQLRYGLLTDHADAAEAQLPGDAAQVELAAARIAALNAKYAPPHRWSPRWPIR